MNLRLVAKSILNVFPVRLQQSLYSTYRNLRSKIHTIRCFMYDYKNYSKEAGYQSPTSREALEASLISNYHGVEKGLSLPSPRPGFGREMIQTIIKEMEVYIGLYGADSTTCAALNSLCQYLDFNKKNNVDTKQLQTQIIALKLYHDEKMIHADGGVKAVTREEIWKDGRMDLGAFFYSRYSIRQFSDEPLSQDTIKQAVLLAQKTPSVCNRQSGSVFVVRDHERILQLLSMQNGNRGFSHQVDTLLIVTSKLSTFLSAEERNQPWIDGGMFAMTLVYALHSLGAGSCCLNWEVEPALDKEFKKVSGIPPQHSIIMLIAVGNLPVNFTVTQSPRRPLDDVCFLI